MIPVTMMMAITLDGKIAKSSDHFANWTSKEDKVEFVRISKDHEVLMMGEKTFNTFPAPLKDRLSVVFSMDAHEDTENVKWVKGEPGKVLEELESMGHKKALLGGGTMINSLFLKAKLIDEIVVTVEPKLFGDGLSLFGGDYDLDLELLEMRQLNERGTIFLRYKVNY